MPASNSSVLFGIKSLSLLIPTLALLAGCSLPSPETPQEKALNEETAISNFTVRSYSASLVPSTTANSFSIEKSKRIAFEVCLKEIARGKSLQALNFTIQEIDKSVKTDLEGCFNWIEDIPYNVSAKSQYVKLERSIVGKGVYRGIRKVAFAFNPNASAGNPVILDIKKAPEGTLVESEEVQKQLFSNEKSAVKLWVEDARLLTLEKSLTPESLILNYELRFTPSIQTSNEFGEITTKALTSGELTGQITLFHRINLDGKDQWKVLGSAAPTVSEIKKGTISIASDIAVKMIPTRGQIYIGLKLSGKNTEINYTSFEGLYLVGDFDSLKSGGFLKLAAQTSSDAQFSFAKLNATTPMENEESYQKPQIEVAPLEFRFLRVSNETTMTRDVSFQIRACFKHGVDQKAIRSQTFKVMKFQLLGQEPQEIIQVKADNSACIHWDFTIPTNVYECQRYLKGEVAIANKELGLDIHIPVLVNPWEQWGSSGRDMRYVNSNEKIQTVCKSQDILPTTFQIKRYGYSTQSFGYFVDKNLNLGFKKKVNFTIEPQVLTYSNLSSGRESIERIRDGIYLLKIAVMRNPEYDHKTPLVSHFVGLVTAMAGSITVPNLEWVSKDLKAFGNRNTIALQILPVDETKIGDKMQSKDIQFLNSLIETKSGIISPVFTGSIIINVDETSRDLSRVDLSAMNNYFLNKKSVKSENQLIDTLIAEGAESRLKIEQNIEKLAGKTGFAARQNLSILNLSDEKNQKLLGQIAGMNLKYLPQTRIFNDDATILQLAKEKGHLDTTSIRNLIESGKMDIQLHRRFCAWWGFEYLPSLYKEKGGGIPSSRSQFAFQKCLASSNKKAEQPFFTIEALKVVHEINETPTLIAGTNHGVSVGTSFSISNSHSTSLNRSTSVSVKAGLSYKAFDILSLGLDTSYSISHSISDSVSDSNGVSVSETTSMAVQKSRFSVELKKYESCAIVKMNPLQFIVDETAPWYQGRKDLLPMLNENLNEEEKVNVINRGLLICDGQISQMPIQKPVTYYFINQETSVNLGQDQGDDRNRLFFMSLRGEADYNKFMYAIRGLQQKPATAKTTAANHGAQISDLTKVFGSGSAAHPAILK